MTWWHVYDIEDGEGVWSLYLNKKNINNPNIFYRFRYEEGINGYYLRAWVNRLIMWFENGLIILIITHIDTGQRELRIYSNRDWHGTKRIAVERKQ